MADVIELRDLRILATNGVLPFEREQAQPFRVDLDIEVDLRDAGVSDDLADTVDYGAVATKVARLVEQGEHRLMERVAERIAAEILSDDRVSAVDVTVTKLRPPVAVQLGTAAVRIRRP